MRCKRAQYEGKLQARSKIHCTLSCNRLAKSGVPAGLELRRSLTGTSLKRNGNVLKNVMNAGSFVDGLTGRGYVQQPNISSYSLVLAGNPVNI